LVPPFDHKSDEVLAPFYLKRDQQRSLNLLDVGMRGKLPFQNVQDRNDLHRLPSSRSRNMPNQMLLAKGNSYASNLQVFQPKLKQFR
jgi:hypothetical protein